MGANSETCVFTLGDLLRNPNDGMFLIDRDRRFVVFSEACERITGHSSNAVIGTQSHCGTLTDGRDGNGRSLAGALCPSAQVFRGNRTSVRQRMCIRHSDGHHVWVETTYSAILDSDGYVGGVIGIVRDITDAKLREGDISGSQQRSMIMNPDNASIPVNSGIGDEIDGDGTADDGTGALDRILSTIEKREIVNALSRANGQRTLAAKLLGISRSRLYRRMEALGIDPRHLSAVDDEI